MAHTNIELVSKLGVIASTLSSITDLPTLSNSIREIVDSIVNVRYYGLYLIDQNSGKLRMYLSKGFNKEEQQRAEDTAWDRQLRRRARSNMNYYGYLNAYDYDLVAHLAKELQ